MCSMDFCWECGSYGRGEYHRPGVVCKPNDWYAHKIIASEIGNGREHAEEALIYDSAMQLARDRAKIAHERYMASKPGEDKFRSEALGYLQGLTIGAIMRAESMLFESAHVLMHTHMMLAAASQGAGEDPKELQKIIAGMAVRFGEVQRSIQPTNGPGSRTKISVINRRCQGLGSLVHDIRQLKDAVSLWRKPSA